METEIKKRRTRASRIIPPFSHSRFEGDRVAVENNVGGRGPVDVEAMFAQQMVITPYSEYIPVVYLTCGKRQFGNTFYRAGEASLKEKLAKSKRKINDKNIGILKERWGKPGNGILRNLCYTHESPELIHNVIRDYLYYDYPLALLDVGWGIGTNNSILSYFSSSYSDGRAFHLRSRVTGTVGYFSFAIKRDLQLIPVISLVVPKENLLYVKMNFLLTGTIDLSKCLLFIDRELDSPRYPERTIRSNTYMKFLKPYLETLNVDVWKVPASFIKEKCFLSGYQLQEKSIQGMKKEKDEIVEKFLQDIRKRFNPRGEKVTKAEMSRVASIWDPSWDSQINETTITYTHSDGMITEDYATGGTVLTTTGTGTQPYIVAENAI